MVDVGFFVVDFGYYFVYVDVFCDVMVVVVVCGGYVVVEVEM